ncbi:MAG: putative methyltransferase [Ilumatobacteraceae bacterium]|nr:putative methyltransferase [Ilumatobacteraceae bacterium]
MTHYFDEQPTVDSDRRIVVWSLPDGQLTITTDRGVFGHGVVDSGTKLLLLKAPAPPNRGDLLDLGCGTGAIALTMARRAPKALVWAVDTNARARDLCRANAQRNEIPNVNVVHPDEVDPTVRFAAIWSNPPIRIGKEALHQLLLQWLPRLEVGADAHLVVQKHLGSDSLQAWLTEHGLPTARAAIGAGFRVLRVSPAVAGGA